MTASHNPPEYNGFKVYWENGAQIIPPHDAGIAAEIDIASTKPLPLMSLSDAETQGKLVWLTEGYYQTYRAAINQSPYVSKEIESANTTITYTAMHGVGAKMAEDLLHDSGFHKVFSVAEQREPDGNFPTVNFPNPEEKGAMDLVVNLAKVSTPTLLVPTIQMQTDSPLRSELKMTRTKCSRVTKSVCYSRTTCCQSHTLKIS